LPATFSGTPYNVTYSTIGTKTATVTRQGVINSCTVTITAPPPAPGGVRRLGPWDSITNLPPIL
jgi:hypothetical protein